MRVKPAQNCAKPDVVPRRTPSPTDLTSAANFRRRSRRASAARLRSSRLACFLRVASVSWRCFSNQRRWSARSSSARTATVLERAAVTCATRTLASMRRTRSNLSDTAYSQTQGGSVIGIGLRQPRERKRMRSTCRHFPQRQFARPRQLPKTPTRGTLRRPARAGRTPWVHRSVETLRKTERAGDRDANPA